MHKMINEAFLNELIGMQDNPEGEEIKEVLKDFWICALSREVSLMSRKEVLTGKAKFGITGDGKEVPQVALARSLRLGDFRTGYYRDQTLMLALGLCTVEDLFAQLYADKTNDPFTAGRQMNSHFANRMIGSEGEFLNLTSQINISADMSPTAGQMARALGLALASKKFRWVEGLIDKEELSNMGDELVICTIGDASTSEGVFWETVNAAAVLQVPLAICVWDDGYGISVPVELQTAKGSISKALMGFQRTEYEKGIDIYTAKGWDYPSLVEMFEEGLNKVRTEHVPAVFHVKELTQPQGHSTSGSHERYKSQQRLDWEAEHDGLVKMRNWIVSADIAKEEQLDQLVALAKEQAKNAKKNAYDQYTLPVKETLVKLKEFYKEIGALAEGLEPVKKVMAELKGLINPMMAEILANARKMAFVLSRNQIQAPTFFSWLNHELSQHKKAYTSDLLAEGEQAISMVPQIKAIYADNAPVLNGYQILNSFFDVKFEEDSRLFAFGEDVGQIGDVNQGFAGLQEKYGEHRIFDSGIREWTIVGQAIGMAQRGLRPIAEIQYLDYLPYAMSALMDDLATLRYRSGGQQMAPAIIRTRGHRLEGIWHAGSPLGMIVNSLRGMHICVPRNMTQAAGMYNTLLQSKDPGLVIECLNGYRLKEKLPENLSQFTVPLGYPEIMRKGQALTLVSYGSTLRIAQEACERLEEVGIAVELIDVQTLLPFDVTGIIVKSLQKTNRILFVDEDVPGGATAYMMQQVLERDGGYRFLDSAPATLTAVDNRPPYGSDGDYFCKPSAEDIVEKVHAIMNEFDPASFA
jgi:pyruvate/2-oxoglutarate/acetoin dehydrogenase E1 component/TPP-dependent pyruvate/acetoin dehydrogenase alpha subunit